MEPPHPPPTQQHISPGLASGSCLFCGRVWNEHESQPFIMEDRKRKLESLSKDDSFSSTMFRYILGNQPGSSYSSGYKEIFDRFTRVRSQNQSTGHNHLPLCHTCLGLIYELRELHVTLERIQNLIIDKVKEIQEKVQMGQARGGESEEQSPHEAGDNWETTLDNRHDNLFPFPNAGESGGGVSPSFALQNLIMRGEGMGRHGVGDFDVVRNLKMDNELTQVELAEDGRGEINIPSSSQSDCGSSIADGSIDGPNFDGTRRGRRRKPVQLVDNAKKSRQELIAHMKGVNKDLYICDIDGCYAFFNTVQGLSQHKRQHFRDSWPVCGLCSYSTPWPSAMNRHFSTQHPNVDKNIKRPNRRNPSCAFTIKGII